MDSQLVCERNHQAGNAVQALGLLQQVSRDAADGNAGRVLDAAVAIPVECLGVDRAVLLARSAVDDSWTPVCSRNLPQEFLDHSCRLTESCVFHRAATTQSPIVIDDIPSLACSCDCWAIVMQTTCLACIPVSIPTGPPAVLACMKSGGDSFAVWEIEFLNTLANLAAAALKHSFPPSDIGINVRSLAQFSEAACSEVEINEWLDQLLDQTIAILRADSGCVMLSEESLFHVVASRGLSSSADDSTHRAKDGSVSGRVIATRRPLALHGPVGGRCFPAAPTRPEVLSSISIPLINKRRLFGLLTLNRSAPGALFTDEEVAGALAIAHHLAVAIDNARLYDAARAQTRHFGSLYQIARTITSSLDLDSVLKMFAKRLRKLVPHDVFALLLCDQENGQSQLASGHGIQNGKDLDYVKLIAPAARLCTASRRSVVIRNMATHPDDEVKWAGRQLGLSSGIVVALVIKRRIVGYLAAYRQEPGTFPRHITSLLLGLAELAAIAIENARLYQRQSGIAHIARHELVAPSLPSMPGFGVGGRYAPAHEVGGDYYDVIRIDEHRYGLVVADVAGKDVTAALYISMCKHALRALAEHIPSPARLMHKMNHFIHEHTEPEGFISMFYGTLDTRNGSFIYSTAGHEPALLHRAESSKVEQLRTRGMILGVNQDATFGEKATSIQVGDALLLYTDGLVEALSEDGIDGFDALKRLLAEGSLESAQGLADSIHQPALSSQPSRSPDDIAIMVVKRDLEVMP